MANPYSIDFQPLNLGGLSEVVDVYNRASQNRDVNDLKRRELDLREKTLSAEEYRKTEEFKALQDERARKREIDKIAAYDPALRVARQSPELATSLYKSPYGFSFFKSQDLGPGEEGPQLSPSAPVDRQPHPLGPRGEMAAMAQLGDQVDAVSGGAAAPPPPMPPEAAPPEPRPQSRLYVDFGKTGPEGQTAAPVEAPAAPSSPTGYGPKYDAVYEAVMGAGATPLQAFQAAHADYLKDQMSAEKAKAAEAEMAARASSEAAKREHDLSVKGQFNMTAEQQYRLGRERNAAIAASNREKTAATADKKSDKEDATAVRAAEGDPSGVAPGGIIGHVPTGKGGAQGFATRDADYTRAEHTLQALIADVEANGSRVGDPSKAKARDTLYHNAVIGVATVSPLGKTNEAQKLEAESIGMSGAPSLSHPASVVMGANLDALKRKLEEIRHQRKMYRDQTLIPNKPGASAPAHGSENNLDDLETYVNQLGAQ